MARILRTMALVTPTSSVYPSFGRVPRYLQQIARTFLATLFATREGRHCRKRPSGEEEKSDLNWGQFFKGHATAAAAFLEFDTMRRKKEGGSVRPPYQIPHTDLGLSFLPDRIFKKKKNENKDIYSELIITLKTKKYKEQWIRVFFFIVFITRW